MFSSAHTSTASYVEDIGSSSAGVAPRLASIETINVEGSFSFLFDGEDLSQIFYDLGRATEKAKLYQGAYCRYNTATYGFTSVDRPKMVSDKTDNNVMRLETGEERFTRTGRLMNIWHLSMSDHNPFKQRVGYRYQEPVWKDIVRKSMIPHGLDDLSEISTALRIKVQSMSGTVPQDQNGMSRYIVKLTDKLKARSKKSTDDKDKLSALEQDWCELRKEHATLSKSYLLQLTDIQNLFESVWQIPSEAELQYILEYLTEPIVMTTKSTLPVSQKEPSKKKREEIEAAGWRAIRGTDLDNLSESVDKALDLRMDLSNIACLEMANYLRQDSLSKEMVDKFDRHTMTDLMR